MTRRTDKVESLQQALRGLYRKLETRPVPDHIQTVVDQLEAADQPVETAESA